VQELSLSDSGTVGAWYESLHEEQPGVSDRKTLSSRLRRYSPLQAM